MVFTAEDAEDDEASCHCERSEAISTSDMELLRSARNLGLLRCACSYEIASSAAASSQ